MSSTLTLDVCLLASKGISKETIIKDFLNRLLIDEYKIIIGVNAPTTKVEKKVKLQFWIFTSTLDWEEYILKQISGSNGIVIIYDLTDPETLIWASERIQSIKSKLDNVPPILLIGNNVELEDNREISEEQIKDFIEINEISSSMDISLKTGQNIENSFMNLTEMMLRSTESDYQIKVKRIPAPKGYKHLGILIAILIWGISVITSLIVYFIFLVN
jgi:GTPase SAR1 family protein